jgi:TatD DNase family protein
MAHVPPHSTIHASPLRYIDSHIHLDADQFADDLDQVIGDAIRAGVTDFVNIGYEPSRWPTTRKLSERVPGIHAVFGMHPGSAEQWTSDSAKELEHLVTEHRPVAIGEVGIDLFRGETNLAHQRYVFAAQLELALRHDLPVVIHMRAAEAEVIDLMQGHGALPPILFHSFEGSRELTDFAIAIGAFVGVGGLATRVKSEAIRQEISRVDLSHIVLETDAPYLIPAKRRGTRNVPANLPAIAHMLAELKMTDIQSIAAITTANAQRFFQLDRGSES